MRKMYWGGSLYCGRGRKNRIKHNKDMIATGYLDKEMRMIHEQDFIRYDRKVWIVKFDTKGRHWMLERYHGKEGYMIPMNTTMAKQRELVEDVPLSTDYAKLMRLLDAGARIDGIAFGDHTTFYKQPDEQMYYIGGQISATADDFGDEEYARWPHYLDYFVDCCRLRKLAFVDPADLR